MWPLGGLASVLALVILVDVVLSSSSVTSKCLPKSCRNSEGGRPVCGTDGLTYPNRCFLELTRCHHQRGSNATGVVAFSKRGPCPRRSKCVGHVGIDPTSSSSLGFEPKCRSDGAFAASQCSAPIGYCWCVNPQGLPLPYTVVKYADGARPKCGKKHRKSTTRRSSKSRRPAKTCRRQDKAQFNANLIRIVHSEWTREQQHQQNYHVAFGSNGGPDLDRVVLEWKFNQMDEDKSGNLNKNEYRELRRIVKKAVKPLKCAKSFPRSCDVDKDQLVARQEWTDCLSRDGMDDGRAGHEEEEDEEEDDEEEGDDPFTTPRSPPHGVLTGDRSANGHIFEDESSERRDEDSTDCLSDRQTALSEQRADKRYELYIPECTPDGRYKKVQCYKSAGYCWCVHEDTGKNIPGTSVKNQTPKCDQIAAVSRPMKGCPEEKKITFLGDLMDHFHAKMAKETNGTNMAGTSGPGWKVSREEQVATWSFVVFDKNKNKMLEKSEWKAFKDAVSAVKNLRKCGKKLPRYCDINKDRQISMTEWLDCLNTNRNNVPEIASTTFSPGSGRTGKNPLSVLMED